MNETRSEHTELSGLSREEMHSVLLAQLIMQQSNMAMMLLGKVPDPRSGKAVHDLEAARLFIDQLEALEAKTKGNLTKEEEALLKQNLMALQNQLQYDLAEEQQVAQNKVFNAIKVYLQNMKGAENIKYVLGDGAGSSIMYANESMDITKKVIEGLNEEYQKTKEKDK